MTQKKNLLDNQLKRQAVTNSENTLFAIKRLIGRKFDGASVQKDISKVPYKIVKSDNGDAWVAPQDKKLAPPQVSAEVLRKIACNYLWVLRNDNQ